MEINKFTLLKYFPTGLIFHHGTYYISYGQSDKYSKILKLNQPTYDNLFMSGNFKQLVVSKAQVKEESITQLEFKETDTMIGGKRHKLTEQRKNKKRKSNKK